MANTATDGTSAALDSRRPLLATEDVAAFSRTLGEAPMGAQWRQRAAEVAATIDYPDRVRHLWKYTDPGRLAPQRSLLQVPQEVAPFDLPDTPAVLIQPGRAPQPNAAAIASGIEVRALLHQDADVEWIGRAVPADHGYFEAMNAAAFNAGVLVRIPRRHVAEAPLRLVMAAEAGRDVLPRVLVIAEESSQATVVEDHTGGGDGAVVIGVTELLAGDNADLHHVLVQRWQDGTVGHLTHRAEVSRDGKYLGAIAGFGGDVAKADLGGILAGPGARSEMIGVTLPDRRQRLDHHTLHRHTSGHTWSNIDFKAAVSGRARSAYTGLLRIEANAPSSEAYQENRNLLLSERAHADTIPELEILTDEVSCSHGATAAPIDPEQIFYLQSRGIPADRALRLVVRGFVEPTLQQVPGGLRAELEELVEERLARLEGSA
ncbi:Fe-S cluster assembly protein SufD [bacterium]|nr:Fe-S cluster assembly protein SufD [bacterium]